MPRITLNLLPFIIIASLFNASFILANDCTFTHEENGIKVQLRVIPKLEIKTLFHDFPHDESKFPHVDPENPRDVAKYSSPDAYKELFDKDFHHNGIHLVGIRIENTGKKPLYLTQESIKIKSQSRESKQCLLDQAEVSSRINVWFAGGLLIPVIGWLILYSSIDHEIYKFLKEYGIPSDGLTLEPGKIFQTILFIDNTFSAPAPAFFEINLKIFNQLSWYKTQYTKIHAHLPNNV